MSESNILRVGDPETSRLVAFLNKEGQVVGAGCLITADQVLTCRHVVQAAVGRKDVPKGTELKIRLCGLDTPRITRARFQTHESTAGFTGDIACVRLVRSRGKPLTMTDTEFATPFRHGGKRYSVVGFPEGNPDGYYASGTMRGANVAGLVQLDGEGAILVQPGFSGAPVWSSDLNAYVGLVVSGLENRNVAWCIPSRLLCRFFPKLPVRFRVSKPDRPDVHDFRADDPNVPLFGTVSDNGARRLTVTKVKKDKWGFRVDIRYECLKGEPRGRFVTFITHPMMSRDMEDAYELFSELDGKVATNYFWSKYAFTVAAIGDGGDTALTYDVAAFPDCPEGMG